ncbi:MAG: alpha/beta hydrolase [Bryobacteraceae bacterium]|nr:alpha/beta hydrolase [Bryobacteraceae bacterium]MDW8379942.1 alpha/beta hydrolase [Bryobacterales bacterium]
MRSVVICVAGLFALLPQLCPAQARKYATPYGSNPAAGRTFVHDGVKLYYETYGAGEPLLVVHGNGGHIQHLAAQIDYFRKSYRVIAMDSRDHGKSADSPGPLTYELMAGDLAALLDHLKVGPANILGWSDGAIEALLLGIHYPAKVKKIAAMAANLNPTPTALHPDALAWIHKTVAEMPPLATATPAQRRERKVVSMMLSHPNIDPKELRKITAPTLVLAGDHDLITDEHTIEIFHHLPNAQLCIFPDATHMIPFDDPARFNAVVERFFRQPFVKRDRLRDFLKSLELMTK